MFVIDKLLVGVHQERSLDSPIIKAFPTGTVLEVLKREGELAQVRGPGNVIGWVDAVYLTGEQPASAKLADIETQNQKLREDLKAANDKLESMQQQPPVSDAEDREPNVDKIAVLEQEMTRLRQSLDAERNHSADLSKQLDKAANESTSQKSLDDLLAENSALKQELEDAQIKTIKALESAPPAEPRATGISSPIATSLFGSYCIGASARRIRSWRLVDGLHTTSPPWRFPHLISGV